MMPACSYRIVVTFANEQAVRLRTFPKITQMTFLAWTDLLLDITDRASEFGSLEFNLDLAIGLLGFGTIV